MRSELVVTTYMPLHTSHGTSKHQRPTWTACCTAETALMRRHMKRRGYIASHGRKLTPRRHAHAEQYFPDALISTSRAPESWMPPHCTCEEAWEYRYDTPRPLATPYSELHGLVGILTGRERLGLARLVHHLDLTLDHHPGIERQLPLHGELFAPNQRRGAVGHEREHLV